MPPKQKVEHSVDFLKTQLTDVRNKEKRKVLVRDLRIKQRKEKMARRKLRDAEGRPKQIPMTIENMRVPDKTELIVGDEEVLMDEGLLKRDDSAIAKKEEVEEENSEEVSEEEEEKESFSNNKVLITCSTDPSRRTRMFCRQLAATLPNCEFRWRRKMSIKKSTKQLVALGYTAYVVVSEHREEPNGMMISRLPEGPTARFRLSSMQLAGELHGMSKRQSALVAPPSKKRAQAAGNAEEPLPQLLRNQFTTRLGLRVSNLLSCLFPEESYQESPEPVDNGRVITFHNQRDYIFFRQHRFAPSSLSNRTFRLIETGPRFTLRLRAVQPTTFDCRHGEFEWVFRHHEMEQNRRKFVL